MTRVNPTEIISKYPKVIHRIFDNLESDDLVVLGVSIDTFGFMAALDDGKKALNKIYGKYKNLSI